MEECAERLTDEDVDALCELVAAHLGGGEASGEAEAAAATVEGGAMEVSVGSGGGGGLSLWVGGHLTYVHTRTHTITGGGGRQCRRGGSHSRRRGGMKLCFVLLQRS